MKKIIILLLLNTFLISSMAYAQLQYNLVSEGGPGVPNPYPITKNNGGSQKIVGYFFDLVIGISIALAVILFMAGAFGNMFGESSSISKRFNKDLMKNSVIGLILTLTMYLILQTISPDLVKFPLFDNLNFASKNGGAAQPSGTTISTP